MNHYKKLIAHTRQLKLIDSVIQLLDWDQETYMPSGSVHARAEQVEWLAGLQHKEKTSRRYARGLNALINLETGQLTIENASEHQRVTLKLLRRDYNKQKALPSRFVRAFAKLTSQAHPIWAQARKENNFSLFLPSLKELIHLNQQKADYLGYQHHPYDALLDEFEPEMTTAKLDPLFGQLGPALSALLKKITHPSPSFLPGNFPQEPQLAFSEYLLQKVGFNRAIGRLDLSTHPFCVALHPTDLRITTRFHLSSPIECVSSVLHEAGHALYEMGLPQDYFGTPICEAISLGIHESQSRFWETCIGQHRFFWELVYPKLVEYFPEALRNVSLEDYYRAVNHVSASFIRVEADEVTYCLHILVRYEIEKALISGELSAHDLPKAWNALMKSLLGITPPTDREGCLQDVHWSKGAFGYFPTYALGNLYAAQFFETFEKSHPKWGERVKQEGNFHFITAWLREEIHQYGHLYSAEELSQKVSGSPLQTTAYLNYLQKKYVSQKQ